VVVAISFLLSLIAHPNGNFFFRFPVLECPKRSLLIAGRNLLEIFGPGFVKCYTFHIAKQWHIILSRMVQSKRLHRRLKDALRARAAAVTWSEE
jgi:hypothetical protein